jgi:hypothetical protein
MLAKIIADANLPTNKERFGAGFIPKIYIFIPVAF